MLGQAEKLECLQTDWLLAQFGTQRKQVITGYLNFVRAGGVGLPPVWNGLKGQVFLGNEEFVDKMQNQIKVVANELTEISRAERRSIGRPLNYCVEKYLPAKEGMRKAFKTGDYSTVSRAVNTNLWKND